MSKHWNPHVIHGRSPKRRRPYRGRRPQQRGSRFGWRDLGVVLMMGVTAGLGYAALAGESGTAVAALGGTAMATRVDDPWAVSITDGDTFRYRGERIRIADIDTPEVQGRCAYETRLAAQATERMEGLLREGPFEMQPIPGRDEDQYGRKLRVIVRDGRSLGDQLVGEGLARTWEGQRRPWCG